MIKIPQKKDKEKKKAEYINKIFRGEKLKSGTRSYQPEEYEGFKYIKQIIKFFEDKDGVYSFSKIKDSLIMPQDDKIPVKSFVQMRILKLEKFKQKVDDRIFSIGDFGEFLLKKYLSSSYEVMLLSSFLNYSIIPYIINDLNNILHLELTDTNIKKTDILSQLNKAKRNNIMELLGLYTRASDSVYCTIPIFYKNIDINTKKIKIQEYNPELKEQASTISLDFAFKEIYQIIRNLNIGNELFITLEDLYNYLVRPKRLIQDYNFDIFNENKYSFSGMLFFLRDESDSIEDEDVYIFKKVFKAVQVRNKKLKVDPILDEKIKQNIKNPEFYIRMEYLE